MRNKPLVNFIITIHNKEILIRNVLESVIQCCNAQSTIYPVLDGCTDDTEKIVDDIIRRNKNVKIIKVVTNDVHELLSINAALEKVDTKREGYNIILQDDVIIKDFKIISKIIKLYNWNPKIGVVSFRLGANFTSDAADSSSSIPQTDFIENAFGHGIEEADVLLPGQFAFREIAIKSPICIPNKLIRELGMLEEKLAPYAHDDLEYAIRCWKNGYKNGVFAIEFESDIKWGGTRTNPHPEMQKIIDRNIKAVRNWHYKDIKEISKLPKDYNKYTIIKDDLKLNLKSSALQTWEENKNKLKLHIQQSRNKSLLYNLINLAKRNIHDILKHHIEQRMHLKYIGGTNFDELKSLKEVTKIMKSPNSIYRYLHYHAHNFLPKELLKHRRYFTKKDRGFGEDAFHSMWWFIFKEYQPYNCLEIGVYRGQVISLWALISKILNKDVIVSGISPLSPIGDSVSTYINNIDYKKDIHESFRHFDLEKPILIKALSTAPLALSHFKSRKWDLIYIDGSHDEKIVYQDYKNSLKSLRKGGILVFDDSSLYLNYQAPKFAFAGHPGPSKIVKKFAMKELRHIITAGHCNVFIKV